MGHYRNKECKHLRKRNYEMSYQNVTLLGRIGTDIELRDHNGQSVANFSLATEKTWNDKNKGKQSKTSWHNITVWGGLTKVLDYVSKGSQIFLEGELDYQEYEKDGVKKYITKINAKNIRLVDNKKNESTEIPV